MAALDAIGKGAAIPEKTSPEAAPGLLVQPLQPVLEQMSSPSAPGN